MREISKEGTKRHFTAKRSSVLKVVVFSTRAETLKADWFCVYCRLLWSAFTCGWVVPRFSPGRDFCLAGSATFGSSLCRSEKASCSVSVTTNDYQWIWASRQNCQQLQGPGGGGGPCTPRRQRFPPTSHTHTHTRRQATKPLIWCAWRLNQSALRGWIWCCMSGGRLVQQPAKPMESYDSDQAFFPSLPPFICIPKVKAPSELCFARKSLAVKSK